MNNSIHVAFYLRSATGNLSDLRRQKKILEKEFVRKEVGFTGSSVSIYTDTHESGLSYGPELLRLIEDVKNGNIHVVMVSRMNRISRTLKGLGKFYDLIKTYKFRFISENENIDSFNWPWAAKEVAHEIR